MKKNSKRDRDQRIIDDFKDKKSRYQDYWFPIYEECQKHLTFTLEGKQFDDQYWSNMGITNPKQPNLLLTYANHEANKTLQTDYKIKVTPNGSGASVIAARERQEVLRGLQRTTNINQVFNRVRRNQVAGGIAYSIAVLDYAGRRGFGKTLKDEFLEDWKNVFPDINVKTPTFSDMRDFLIKRMIPISEWESETGEKPEGWGNKKEKELWSYWVREDVRDTEYLLKDGKTAMGSKLKGEAKDPDLSNVEMGDDEQPLSRPTEDYTWCWYKISEDDVILDEEVWKGSYPPMVAATGRKVVDKEGKVHYQPLTQFAEEPQQIYTLLENIITLRLNRSPFSKWLVALESINIKDMETLRKVAMLGNMDILYKSTDDAGNTIPAPVEIEPHILDPLLIQLQQEQERKIQRIFGIFDANLGEKSNEQSGVAIERRAQGGELSNYDLQFLYMEYVEQVGRVKLDLIPKYLRAQQQMAFVDEDDNAVLRWINVTGGVQFSPDEEYSLSVEAMPISQTAREDEAAALIDMAKVIPGLAQNTQAASFIVKSMPGRYSQQIAEIMQQGDPKLQEAQQMIQQLQGKLQEAQLQVMQAKAQATQDQITIAGMKQAVNGMKQQQALFKQLTSIEGATIDAKAQYAEMQAKINDAMSQTDKSLEAAELEIKRFEATKKAETDQQKADNDTIKANAAMIIAVDKASRPDPQPKPASAA